MKIDWSNYRRAVPVVREIARQHNCRCRVCGGSLDPIAGGSCRVDANRRGDLVSLDVGAIKIRLRCAVCEKYYPLPARLKKELAKRLPG